MVWQALANGLVMGSLYALVAAGLTLVFGVLRIINVAHGDFLMLAMYGYFFLQQKLGLDPYLSILIVTPLLFGLGNVVFRVFIRPVIDDPPMSKLLITMGLSLILANGALFLFAADYRSLTLSYGQSKFTVGNVNLTWTEAAVFVGSLSITGALYWILRRTSLGRHIRAVAQSREAAALAGVDVFRIYALSFSIGAACAGIAGGLLMPIYYVYPEVGLMFLLIAFVVIVLGGMGNFGGALAGGLIIGVVESISGLYMPGSSAPLVIFVVFIAILLVRPQGLLSRGPAS